MSDPFDPATLRTLEDPFPVYAALRDQGPVVERALGSEPHAVPNLGGLDIRCLEDGTLELTQRTVLIDAQSVTVTSPPEV